MKARLLLLGMVLVLLVGAAPVAAQDWNSAGVTSVANREADTEVLIRVVVSRNPITMEPDEFAYRRITLANLLRGLVMFPGPDRNFWGAFANDDSDLTDDYFMGTAGGMGTSQTNRVVIPQFNGATDTFVRIGMLIPTAWLPLPAGYPRQEAGFPAAPWTTVRTTTVNSIDYTVISDNTNRIAAEVANDASRTYLARPAPPQ